MDVGFVLSQAQVARQLDGTDEIDVVNLASVFGPWFPLGGGRMRNIFRTYLMFKRRHALVYTGPRAGLGPRRSCDNSRPLHFHGGSSCKP